MTRKILFDDVHGGRSEEIRLTLVKSALTFFGVAREYRRFATRVTMPTTIA